MALRVAPLDRLHRHSNDAKHNGQLKVQKENFLHLLTFVIYLYCETLCCLKKYIQCYTHKRQVQIMPLFNSSYESKMLTVAAG